MATVGVNVELSGLLAVGGISVATLMWDHHSNHGRVLATLEKSFSALGKFLFGGANEKTQNGQPCSCVGSWTKIPEDDENGNIISFFNEYPSPNRYSQQLSAVYAFDKMP